MFGVLKGCFRVVFRDTISPRFCITSLYSTNKQETKVKKIFPVLKNM